jgi:hypothetical protein
LKYIKEGLFYLEVLNMYCSIQSVREILPEKVTIGDQNIGTPSPGRPLSSGTSGRSNISVAQAEDYIDYAQQYIDSRLRNTYVCPLRRTKSWEGDISANIIHGTNVIVTVRDSGPFNRGGVVRLQDKSKYENANITNVPSITTVTLETVVNDYSATDTKISVLEYPDPIVIVTARLACAIILDRLFNAEQAPDVSSYGKTQRNLAKNSVDSILIGEISLTGQEHTGRRFIRGSLLDAYKSPAEITKGQEKE